MSTYIHQTPGRLRVRTEGTKLCAKTLGEGAEAVLHVAGVREVSMRTKTGTLTIHFDPHTVSAGRLINELAAVGILEGIVGLPMPPPLRWTPPRSRFGWSPRTKKVVLAAAKLLLPIVAERAFGKPGKAIASALL